VEANDGGAAEVTCRVWVFRIRGIAARNKRSGTIIATGRSMGVNQVWLAVLSSSLLSGIVGAIVGGIFSLRGKHKEYVNDYYKTIINRRLAAYEKVEVLIRNLKAAVVAPEDSRPYHLLFSSETDDDWKRVFC
jgi:hypothetical protein